MMTDGCCAGVLGRFVPLVHCGDSDYSIIHHCSLVRLQMLELHVFQVLATNYRKTINRIVFLNILSYGLKEEVETLE